MGKAPTKTFVGLPEHWKEPTEMFVGLPDHWKELNVLLLPHRNLVTLFVMDDIAELHLIRDSSKILIIYFWKYYIVLKVFWKQTLLVHKSLAEQKDNWKENKAQLNKTVNLSPEHCEEWSLMTDDTEAILRIERVQLESSDNLKKTAIYHFLTITMGVPLAQKPTNYVPIVLVNHVQIQKKEIQ
jgi:hypothetical protein